MTAKRPESPPLDPHEEKIQRDASAADASAATAATPPKHGTPKPPARVTATWAGEQRFDAGQPDGPTLRLDGSGDSGQSPVDALLSALAACAGIDVVEILAKRKTPAASLRIDMTGERVNTVPRRFSHIRFDVRIAGDGIERVHAERAVELSIDRYCSVRGSLSADIAIEWAVELNGEAGSVRTGAAARASGS